MDYQLSRVPSCEGDLNQLPPEHDDCPEAGEEVEDPEGDDGFLPVAVLDDDAEVALRDDGAVVERLEAEVP